MKPKKKIKATGLRKCIIILVMPDGTVISQEGHYEGKKIENIAIITAHMAIHLPADKKK